MSLDLIQVSITPPRGSRPLFRELSLSVPAGDVVTIMGPSGVGKSTLLDMLGGHLPHGFKASGRVSLNDRDVTRLPAEARQIGILFQDPLMFPHLSVGDNLAFGLARHVRGGSARRGAVEAALEQAGLAGLYERDPATLSGGQRTRAALMRAMLAEPLALLLDEPFSKLDTELRAEIRLFVFGHIRARGIPVLMVTHDESDAAVAGGAIVTL